ncbi:MAG: cupin domain-containing protein [Candidatus Dormibacteraeota bacterium]|uniref:Cupin domain-containing protein n=1 Tax=Candidatus Dormiibacter inghamiae TaxID=3127013 RepID=A0A934KCF4_9BACT|nr:cupin domain-containing protein [Candidatus Dormibacteraeota bacterium]MBJ7606075.1 cupin domain-containing protein [Candidatus Dormibacteraeota bacterium]
MTNQACPPRLEAGVNFRDHSHEGSAAAGALVIEKGEDLGPLAQTNAEAEALWCLGELQAVLAAGEQTGDGVSLVEHEALAGHSPPWHRQPGDDETFYVLEGEMTFWAGDSGRPYQRVGRGAMVFIPRGFRPLFASNRRPLAG